MEPDELEDRTNDNDGECEVPYLEVEMRTVFEEQIEILCKELGVSLRIFTGGSNDE